jgi:hypothetical protein
MSLTTDVEFEVRGSLPSDVVVGADWLSLWRYVACEDVPLPENTCAQTGHDPPGMTLLADIFVLMFL